jgi:hypothetical protein
MQNAQEVCSGDALRRSMVYDQYHLNIDNTHGHNNTLSAEGGGEPLNSSSSSLAASISHYDKKFQATEEEHKRLTESALLPPLATRNNRIGV